MTQVTGDTRNREQRGTRARGATSAAFLDVIFQVAPKMWMSDADRVNLLWATPSTRKPRSVLLVASAARPRGGAA